MSLTPKQRQFVDSYVRHGSAQGLQPRLAILASVHDKQRTRY
jgi:hypothetical protein